MQSTISDLMIQQYLAKSAILYIVEICNLGIRVQHKIKHVV